MPTAELLGRFYKELREEGLDSDQAFVLVEHAAKAILSWTPFVLELKA